MDLSTQCSKRTVRFQNSLQEISNSFSLFKSINVKFILFSYNFPLLGYSCIDFDFDIPVPNRMALEQAEKVVDFFHLEYRKPLALVTFDLLWQLPLICTQL